MSHQRAELETGMESKDKRHVPEVADVVPSGRLLRLKLDQIKPSTGNPRHLFDPEPLHELKENIRQHGVLVPITVYQLKGQDKYAILDGERRFRCCRELRDDGLDITIPANVVDPPTKIAGLLYMFSIHNFREQWELMPTALSLKIVMDELGVKDNSAITKLTGLSEPQIERCKLLLSFPERYQQLSLDPDPKTRIPSNFWIELSPVLDLCKNELPRLYERLGRSEIIDKLVEKYRARNVKSVIHFRRIMEVYEVNDGEVRKEVLKRIQDYVLKPELETRASFDEFVVDARRIQGAIGACEDFIRQVERLKIDYTLERDDLRNALLGVKRFVDGVLQKLEGTDAPSAEENGEEA